MLCYLNSSLNVGFYHSEMGGHTGDSVPAYQQLEVMYAEDG